MAGKRTGKTDLGMTQLFRMGPKNLDKRFNDFFTATKDVLHVVQCAIAVRVRNGLSCGDFSSVAKELIRELYLTNDEVRSMPLTCIYFRDYFKNEEWASVKSRLFASEAEFQQLTGSTSTYLEPVRSKLTSGAQEVERRTSMISHFKDAAGKRHSWSLSNVNPAITKEEHYRLLSILSTLEIFEKDGVRRFAEPIYADFMVYHPGFDGRQEEELQRLQQLSGRLLPVRTQAASIQGGTPAQTAQGSTDSDKSQQAAAQKQVEKATKTQPTTAYIFAEKKGNPAELKAYLFEGFDTASVSEEELAKLATVALMKGKQVKDVVGLAHLVEFNWDDQLETADDLEELFNFEEMTDLLVNFDADSIEEAEDPAADKTNHELSKKERQKLMQEYNRKKKGKGKRGKRKKRK